MSTICTGPQFFIVTFNGGTGAGAISVPGLKAGDYVMITTAFASDGYADITGLFQRFITVDDEIQQVYPADISSYACTATVMRS